MFILEVGRGYPDERWPLYGIFEYDQAISLKKLGHRVYYAAVDVRSIRRKRRFGLYQTEKDGIPAFVFSFPVGALRGADVVVSGWGFDKLLAKLIKEQGKPDVIHAHFFDVAAAARKAAEKYGIPLVVTEHSSKANRRDMDEKEQKIQKAGYGGAASVIAVSTALRDNIRANTGIEAVVIPDVLRFPDKEAARVPGETEGVRFISASNLLVNKGFDLLTEAFAGVARSLPNAELLIMGDGPERSRIENRIAELGLSDRVTMTGRYTRDQFALELTKSDVFVLPSRGETFGVVYAEALSCGVPVIATRCGGPEDMVTAENGLLVDCEDIGALADAMLYMASHLDGFDRERIAENCRNRYSQKTVAEQVTRVLESVVKKEETI